MKKRILQRMLFELALALNKVSKSAGSDYFLAIPISFAFTNLERLLSIGNEGYRETCVTGF